MRFVNRKDWQPSSSSYICIKHFEEKYYKKVKNNRRYRLLMNMKPFAIFATIRKKLTIKIHNKQCYLTNLYSSETTEEMFISRRLLTSSHMFKREIWDKFTEFTFLKFWNFPRKTREISKFEKMNVVNFPQISRINMWFLHYNNYCDFL